MGNLERPKMGYNPSDNNHKTMNNDKRNGDHNISWKVVKLSKLDSN